MNRILTVLVSAVSILVGCDGLPAPAQYDHAMLREYFGTSPAEVEDTFGMPSSKTREEVQSQPEHATADEREEFRKATGSLSYIYSTVDGDLVFHFNLNEHWYAIDYAGKTVSPPDPPSGG